MDGLFELGKSDKVRRSTINLWPQTHHQAAEETQQQWLLLCHVIMLSCSVGAHLDEEEAGSRGGVMVDVDGDQHTGNHDEHHQQDAEDQAGVQRVCAWHPAHCAFCWENKQKQTHKNIFYSFSYTDPDTAKVLKHC